MALRRCAAGLAACAAAGAVHEEMCSKMTVIEQTLWPDHCVQGTEDAELHPGLVRNPSDPREYYLRKGDKPHVDSYSAFKDNAGGTDTGLDGELRRRGITELFVAGLATDFCVWFSAHDAAALGYKVNIVEDATRPIFPDAVARLKAAHDNVKWTVESEVTAGPHAALIVVDVQNCFSSTGTLPVGKSGTDSAGESVVPPINRLRQGSWGAIVYTQDWHLPNQTSFASQHAHDGCEAFQSHAFVCHDGECCRRGDSAAHARAHYDSCRCVAAAAAWPTKYSTEVLGTCGVPLEVKIERPATKDSVLEPNTTMALYDDVRTLYAERVFSVYSPLLAPTAGTAQRYALARSVDVMSYTVGIQHLYDAHPPTPLGGGWRHWGPWASTLPWAGSNVRLSPGLGSEHERVSIQLLLAGLGNNLHGVDIGSGYGGWMRLLSSQAQVRALTGIELQSYVRALASRLSDYAALGSNITFWDGAGGEARAERWLAAPGPQVDFVISHLAFLHIGDQHTRSDLLRGIYKRLHPGGRLLVEDFVGLPAAAERVEWEAKVKRVVWMADVFPISRYQELLRDAGFTPLEGQPSAVWDPTAAWKEFVAARWQAFRQMRSGTPLCLNTTSGVVQTRPAVQDGMQCKMLREIIGPKHAQRYIGTQGRFFCEVCELFWGKGELALRDCGCPTYLLDPSADPRSAPRSHPPLVGGVLILAQRPQLS
eukprot:TRINITY_DN65012_c0_g1_i1.p1 TRINITY_DN65012_c0_g1~~TRINITY_DN65012_c0_g1_i1.p1  ORF type:complete len:735 (+),score=212.84 TRINITY_DN65012_c0_g1_i1:84-2207(+)